MTSWKSPNDPSRGNFTCILVPHGYSEVLLMDNSKVRQQSGPWNGVQYSGTSYLRPNPLYTFEFVSNGKEIFFREHLVNKSTHWRIVTTHDGEIHNLIWIESTQRVANTDNCGSYALCGANGICSIQNSPLCDCLKGFVPIFLRDWNKMDWSKGCVRTPLNCSGDGFQKLSKAKLPEIKSSWINSSMNLDECKNTFLKNYSCIAYSNLDIRNGGSGCVLWSGDLIDVRILPKNDQDVYIRMAACMNLSSVQKILYLLLTRDIVRTKSNVKRRIVVTIALSTTILFLGLALVLYVWKKKQQKNGGLLRNPHKEDDLDLPLFDLSTVACATNNFSDENKLGEGGFEPVYKAWRLFQEGRPEELVSESIIEACNLSQVLHSIQVGLLCVQENREDRPNMSCVCLGLSIQVFTLKGILLKKVYQTEQTIIRKRVLDFTVRGKIKLSWINSSMNLDKCKNTCLKNCSSTAYSNLDIRNGGSGCLLWFGDLIDIRILLENDQDVYIQMVVSKLVMNLSSVYKILTSCDMMQWEFLWLFVCICHAYIAWL
ncbi:hypothetical protein SADUNF_Sadunf16G0274100 [Salix dunnii]|uniref:Apple domain-containing protein n=1 Tax=Salix dunnii TaxID=1413687 RepID=A0A835MK73_9ROSI|nr:hypothetical protein SADUNF_Sadunf16G0274100 [Salix dunnii]